MQRFATVCGGAAPRGQLRNLADDLVLDMVGALRNASLGEVAELVATLERQRKARPTRAKVAAPKPAPAPRVTRQPSMPPRRDPFDITMPGELLDTVARPTVREEEHPPASVRRMRPGPMPRAPRAPRIVDAPQPEPEPAKVPAVSLREGEQLVRASGSGVVIRRVRSA